MKYKITTEQFEERYWKDEFNKLFEYVSFMKIYMQEKDRNLKEIKTDVFNTRWYNFEIWNYVQINWVWVLFEERI